MKRYMLDTNTVSHLLKGHTAVRERTVAVPMASLCISSITEGELLFGLAKRPGAKQLQVVVQEFLRRVESLPWDSNAAASYGTVRAHTAAQGKVLSPLDLLIASHAMSVDAVLVTNDQSISQVAHLHIEDWTVG
jgi:tRNA(fMet)-specific endonuclease VapC